MGNIIKVLLLAIILMVATGYADAKEHINKQKQSLQLSDIEKFKTDLQNVSSNKPKTLKAEVNTLSGRYIISPGDVISVIVFGETDFSQENILVKSDGYATVHPFGEVKIGSLDIDRANDVLKARFARYLVNPRVSVKVNDMRLAKVYIYGAVQRPGLYQKNLNEKNTPLTLASLITNAGGIKHDADIQNIQVININTGSTKSFNLLQMIKEGDTSQDVYLNSEDKVYVPTRDSEAQLSDEDFLLISSSSIAPQEFPVRVMGAVGKPGLHYLSAASPTIQSAVAACEGYAFTANTKVVQVKRITPKGNISTITVNPDKNDMVLRPNDIVQVTENKSSALSKNFGVLGLIFGSAGKFGGAYNQWADMFDPSRRFNYIRED